MKRKIIIIAFVIAAILLGALTTFHRKGYAIKESISKNWKFTDGKLLFKSDKQELKYSIDYIGSNEFEPVDLAFDFLICPKGKYDIISAQHLHSNINGILGKKVDKMYTKKDSFEGQMLDSPKEYNYENLYLRVSYEIDGRKYEEIMKLLLEKL